MDEIRLGVLLEVEAEPEDGWPVGETDLDETGHVPAQGYRGTHRTKMTRRIAVTGEETLHAAATAVGREIASVLVGVAVGLERSALPRADTARTASLDIDDIELKFGVKATLGTGKAIEALLTAAGEATVEVTVRLSRHAGDSAS